MAPRALVTGASRGIGRAVALELARRGHDVVATMRDPAAGDTLRAEAADLPGTVEVERLDVTDPTTIGIPPTLDVLVNNAGVELENRAVEDTPVEQWREVFETNLFGLVEVTRRALPALRATGGVVCCLTTAGLLVPMPFYAVYRASKAAVTALCESLRAEVAPHGVRVLEVLPGPVETDMLARSQHLPEAADNPAYRSLAEHVLVLRAPTDAASTPVDEAARRIVDAIDDEDAPWRLGCDDVGAGLVQAWSSTPDEQHQRSFLDAFLVDP